MLDLPNPKSKSELERLRLFRDEIEGLADKAINQHKPGVLHVGPVCSLPISQAKHIYRLLDDLDIRRQ